MGHPQEDHDLYAPPLSQKEQLLEAFKQRGNRMTLGEMLRHPWGYEARARITELRREGYVITCELKRPASQNLYTLTPPPAPITFDSSGQGMML